MKLSDIITRVQRQFGDEVQAQITKDDIIRWVNDACLEIANANGTSQGIRRGQSQLVAGKNEYELPSDILLLRAVRSNGSKLAPTTFEQITESSTYSESAVGTPETYWVFDGKLFLYPTPETGILGSLDIYYTKTPDLMSPLVLDREPDVPVQYHPRIVEYCIAQAAELDDRLDHYQLKMGQFKDSILSQKQNGEQPESDGYYPSITYIGE